MVEVKVESHKVGSSIKYILKLFHPPTPILKLFHPPTPS